MNGLPDLTYEEIQAKRMYSNDYAGDWYEVIINSEFESDFNSKISGSYEIFIKWFPENCNGHWAYPSAYIMLFTHEEDMIKFILRFA